MVKTTSNFIIIMKQLAVKTLLVLKVSMLFILMSIYIKFTAMNEFNLNGYEF